VENQRIIYLPRLTENTSTKFPLGIDSLEGCTARLYCRRKPPGMKQAEYNTYRTIAIRKYSSGTRAYGANSPTGEHTWST